MNNKEELSNQQKAENYRKEIADLFCEWEQKKSEEKGIDHTKNCFVKDGIVCPETWFSHDIRPLFLLKEAYSSEYQKSWSLVDDLILSHQEIRGARKYTWIPISQWTCGIMNSTKNKIYPYGKIETADYFSDDPYYKNIAIMNIKKSNGNSKSNKKDLMNYADYDAEQLYEEIRLIDPTIIICGYTMEFLDVVYEHKNKKFIKKDNNNQDWIYYADFEGKCIDIIDYYHPAWPLKNKEYKYNCLMNIYQKIILNKS